MRTWPAAWKPVSPCRRASATSSWRTAWRSTRPRPCRGAAPGNLPTTSTSSSSPFRVKAGCSKPWTAAGPTCISDAVGLQVVLAYAASRWELCLIALREYAAPHRAPPGGDPGPNQDRYEALYLDRITGRDPAGESLLTIEVGYAP